MNAADSEGVLADVHSWSWIYWVGVILSLGIAMINLFIGYTEGQTPFLIVGGSFVFGVVLFFTRFWHPVLYLLGVLHVGILGVIWFLDGMRFLTFGVVNGVLSVGIVIIALYLFIEEGMTVDSERSELSN